MEKLAIDGGSQAFDITKHPIPAWPPIYPETEQLLLEIYRSRKWSFNGPYERLFDERFAKCHDASHCVFMVNGTVTLQSALEALGIGPGDEVIVPAHTWIATGMAPLYVGATPVVADIQPDTLCLDPAAFEAAITPRTRAVIPVHLYGSIADMDAICAIAARHGIAVVEDCAHAHGARWDGRGVGSIGDIGSFSFQQSKLMTSGEAGCCLTCNENLAERLDRIKHIGYPRDVKQGCKAEPPEMGLLCHNFRATEFQAGILLEQLAHLQEDTAYREANAEYLRQRIEAIPGIRMQARGRKATAQSFYILAFALNLEELHDGIDRQRVVDAMSAEGIRPGVGWSGGKPIFKQDLWNVAPEKYRVASADVAYENCTRRELVFPLHWLQADRAAVAAFADAIEKVMTAYAG